MCWGRGLTCRVGGLLRVRLLLSFLLDGVVSQGDVLTAHLEGQGPIRELNLYDYPSRSPGLLPGQALLSPRRLPVHFLSPWKLTSRPFLPAAPGLWALSSEMVSCRDWLAWPWGMGLAMGLV